MVRYLNSDCNNLVVRSIKTVNEFKTNLDFFKTKISFIGLAPGPRKKKEKSFTDLKVDTGQMLQLLVATSAK